MKIKTFESYTPDEPWVKVEATDKLEFELKKETEWFTKKEFLEIVKTIKENLNWEYMDNDVKLDFIYPNVQRSYITINLQFMGQKIRIEKYEDEWFFIFFYIENQENKIFKCDQFDALLDCLKNNLHLFDEQIEKESSKREGIGLYPNWIRKIKK